MNINENVFIHNRFDVLVCDANTGGEKQRAVGFNVVVNSFFSMLMTNYNLDHLAYITFGKGVGVPSITDNNLFSSVGRAEASELEKAYEYPTSHVTKQIVLPASSYANIDITEVGFESRRQLTSSYSYHLVSHAMLQDSEGNQISIHKTDTDIVYIIATFYCTYMPGGFGTGGIYPTVEKNSLIRWVLEGTRGFLGISFFRYPLTNSSDLSIKNTGTKNMATGTGNMTTMRYDLPLTTFTEAEANNRVIKHIGVPGVGAITFPNHDIFPPYAIDRIVLGTGDGVTKDFNIKCPLIMAGSEKVFVNNVVQIRGVDYTIDYDNNCGDWDENYASGEYSSKDENILLGDMKERAVSTNSYNDPLACWTYRGASLFPVSFQVTSDKPIYIDFKITKECNTFKIKYPTVPAAQINNLVIEHSADGLTWNSVTTTRADQVWKWNVISARYWRIYIPNYNWTFNMTSSYYQYLMLGKTTPGLSFINPPPVGASVDASYSIEYPFKTENNLLRFTYSIQLQRG